jgi:hypothetical protein
LTLRDNQSSTKLLRATIIAAIIIRPRHCLAILIAAHSLTRLPRFSLSVSLRPGYGAAGAAGTTNGSYDGC